MNSTRRAGGTVPRPASAPACGSHLLKAALISQSRFIQEHENKAAIRRLVSFTVVRQNGIKIFTDVSGWLYNV